MNDQRRQAAIEAGARVLDPKAWDETWANPELRALLRVKAWATAAAVIDAAAPHLVGEPVGWAVVFDNPNPLFDDEGVVYRQRDALDRDYPTARPGVQRCVLVPIEDTP